MPYFNITYDGLKNKLLLDLLTIEDFYQSIPVYDNQISELKHIINYMLYDYVQTTDKILSIKSSIKSNDNSNDIISKKNYGIELRNYCDKLLYLFNLLNSLAIIRNIIEMSVSSELTALLNGIHNDIFDYVLNAGIDGKKLNDIYAELLYVSKDLEADTVKINTLTKSAICNIYNMLKLLAG